MIPVQPPPAATFLDLAVGRALLRIITAFRGASAASDEKCKETSISRREATRNASLLIQRTRISRRSLRSLLEMRLFYEKYGCALVHLDVEERHAHALQARPRREEAARQATDCGRCIQRAADQLPGRPVCLVCLLYFV